MANASAAVSSFDLPALESWLWEAACIIRGPVDAPKFKDYILPLIFLKRLSDVFDDETKRLEQDFGIQQKALKLADAAKNDYSFSPIKLLDTVALLEDIPARKLHAGEVGTVVEVLDEGVYEVEFCDEDGQTYAEFALRANQLIPLHSQGKSLKLALAEA